MSELRYRIIGLTAKGCTTVDGKHTLGCVACGARAITELPEGYVQATVLLTVKEWDRYRTGRSLEAHGTASEAIRRDLDLPPMPYGYFAALARMHDQTENES